MWVCAYINKRDIYIYIYIYTYVAETFRVYLAISFILKYTIVLILCLLLSWKKAFIAE